MPKAEWGKKVVCLNCDAKFYDLNRKPVICPSCNTEFTDPSNEVNTNNAKQVFTDDVDTSSDGNLVGSDASESMAEIEDIEMEDAIDDDTISLEESDSEVSVINEEVDDLSINEHSEEEIEEN